ncbi:hypothetical protein [Thermoactinomyces sp. CICC 10523]|uniref:hypothetical protein n=1 Tax=Thermoactinomyces sp. CICC 10523 TaxID=2767428 RepID=UPI0018DC266E|nr:hypothetical protein [Thermoactinomyces sp. CICC 10523]MBH8597598.1 hypothetical protein [Thermoactinomyces sp. CICC 10523]
MVMKHGVLVVSGILLLLFGISQLTMGSGSPLADAFALTWVILMLFYIIANARQMRRMQEQRRKRMEAERRLEWLAAERKWKKEQMKMRRVKSVSLQ